MFKTKGFTLAELVVVIATVAILVGVITVSYSGLTQRARMNSLKGDAQLAVDSIVSYQLANPDQQYPTSILVCPSPGATQICVIPSGGNTITYTVNNTTDPRQFTVTVSNGALQVVADSANNTVR